MEQAMISKKDLLQRYGISYGALYRWKRMGLIPEDWFQKRSAVTGQETFFPEKLICERIELIQSQKDGISLDELSRQLRDEGQQRLILKTVFGEKSFQTNEIEAIFFENGKGERKDILQELLQACR